MQKKYNPPSIASWSSMAMERRKEAEVMEVKGKPNSNPIINPPNRNKRVSLRL
jgi:hypothetical protein